MNIHCKMVSYVTIQMAKRPRNAGPPIRSAVRVVVAPAYIQRDRPGCSKSATAAVHIIDCDGTVETVAAAAGYR